ncbi:hypothetical protein ABMA67_00525 [Halobacteriovorax sp. RZ-3]|uniref:hypothetical protein n=1 Tax=Halobacteriovorax sp. RZ-3 TaxID=3157720 RepID=UPI00371B6638
MSTPRKYNDEQVKNLIRSYKPNLFHHTKLSSVQGILNYKSIYSIGTLWAIDSSTRTSIIFNRNRSYKQSAELGFIDYVYLTNINRINPDSQANTIYGKVAFEVSSDILLNKESFFYPFNTAYWGNYSSQQKYSDASIFEFTMQNGWASNEYLVRRKVDLTSFLTKIHICEKDEDEFYSILAETAPEWKDRIEIHKDGANMTKIDHEIVNLCVTLCDGERKFPASSLFYHEGNNEIIYAKDEESESIIGFKVIGNELFDLFDTNKKLGHIEY